jgi:hypothetical protein
VNPTEILLGEISRQNLVGCQVAPLSTNQTHQNRTRQLDKLNRQSEEKEAAGRAIKRNTAIKVNDDTIRSANHIGQLVFNKDQERAKNAWDLFYSGKLTFPKNKKPFFFI